MDAEASACGDTRPGPARRRAGALRCLAGGTLPLYKQRMPRIPRNPGRSDGRKAAAMQDPPVVPGPCRRARRHRAVALPAASGPGAAVARLTRPAAEAGAAGWAAAGAAFLAAAILSAAALAVPAAPAAAEPAPSATDGFFQVYRLDPGTYAITAPSRWGVDVSYVILGKERGLLVDTGSGSGDLPRMASMVSRKPMTAIATDLHHDHVGAHNRFARVAMVDLPCTRAAAQGDQLSPSRATAASLMPPSFRVTEWWPPGQRIDLGDRIVELVSLPGHAPESIAIVDRVHGQAFVGDSAYADAPLFGNLPGADLAAWRDSLQRLLQQFPEVQQVYGGHGRWDGNRATLEQAASLLDDAASGHIAGERLWKLAGTASSYRRGNLELWAPAP